ncbi:hypothetical protein JCM3765_006747 [Sporobolomyces pararoseus]
MMKPVPNVSPLSRTSALPPLTSINTSTSSGNGPALPPPPPYSAPPPIRSRSVPHLSQLSSSIHSRSPSSTGSPEWTQSYLVNNEAAANSRRTVRPSRSRTSSSNSLGLAFNNGNSAGMRSRLPSFEETFSLTGGGGILPSAPITRTPFDTDEEEDADEGEALEIRRRSAAGGEVRRRIRQPSENGTQVSSQRRNGNGSGNGGASFGRTRSTDSALNSATSPPPPRSRIWTPLFFLLNFLSVIPSLIGFLYSLHRFFSTSSPSYSSGIVYSQSTRLDWFISSMWSLSCAYFTHSLARGLLKRWLVYYPLGPTIVRVLSLQAICWPLTLTTHRVLSFDQPVAGWFVCATTAAISNVIQSWVTSNIVESSSSRQKNSRLSPARWTSFSSRLITAVLGPGIRTDKYRKGERVLSWKRVLWGTVLPFAVLGWASMNCLLWQQYLERYHDFGTRSARAGGVGLNMEIPGWKSSSALNNRLEGGDGEGNVRVLVLISSSWSEQSRLNRQSFRQTSLALLQNNENSSRSQSLAAGLQVEHRFLLGDPPSPQQASKLGPRLEEEAQQFGDLLILPSNDQAKSLKLWHSLKWASGGSVQELDYVIQTEDEVFVRMDVVGRELRQLGKGRKGYWRGFLYSNMPNSEIRTSSYNLPLLPPYTDSTLTILSHDLLSLMIPSQTTSTSSWLPRVTSRDDESLGIWLYPFSTNFSPLHDHRIQRDQRICEDDLIARRVNVGREDAKGMFRNLREEKKMCEGLLGTEKKYCGVCYPSCRGKDYHWRDHFRLPGGGGGGAKVECDEIKGLTISSSAPNSASPACHSHSSRVDSLSGTLQTSSSPSVPPWSVPDILSSDPVALSTTRDSSHLLHFRIRLNPDKPVLSHLESLAFESIWIQEPKAIIVILTSSTSRTPSKEQEEKIQRYRQMGYGLDVVEAGKKEIREREWWAGEKSRAWVENWDKWEKTSFSTFRSDLEEYLKFLVLFKYGGTIVDPSSIHLDSPSRFPRQFISTSRSPFVNDDQWTLDDQGTYLSASRSLRTIQGSELMKEVLETWFDENRYSHHLLFNGGGNEGSQEHRFGSRALTLTYASSHPSWSQSGITLLPPTKEDSKSVKQTLKLFEPLETPQQAVSYLQNLTESDNWTLDLLDHELLSRIPIQPGSVVDTVIRQFSLNSFGTEEAVSESLFELRYPKTVDIVRHGIEAGQQFTGLKRIYLRLRRNDTTVSLARPFQSVRVKISAVGSVGGKVSLGGKAGVAGAREIDLKIESVRLRDINEILSEIRYFRPSLSPMESITATEEHVLEVSIEADGESVVGKIVVNLL